MQELDDLEEVLVLEGAEIIYVMISFLNKLSIKVKDDQFGINLVPFEELYGQSEEIGIELWAVHDLKEVVLRSVEHAIPQKPRVVLYWGESVGSTFHF